MNIGGAMKFGSLFTGVGGFDLGFERAGMKCEWQVEFDKNCQNILRKHWSETELFDDVRTVGKHNLKPVDVICGGFPCQDVSIAGKRAGLAGERSGLWSEFARIIDELEPKWVVIENVPGLLSSNRGRDFATVIRWLAERGYGVAWRILDSQYFGVAQRRRRVFIVASFGNGNASEILFEREGVRWDIEKGRKTGKGTAGTVEDGSSKCRSDITSGQQDANVVVGALQACDYKGVGNQYVNEEKVITMSSGQANAEIMSERSPSLTGLHEQPIVAMRDDVASSITGHYHKGVGSDDLNMVMVSPVLGFDLAQITSKANQSNPKKGGPQPTLNASGQGYIAYENHPQDSRITETGNITQQLTSRMGTGGGNVPLVQAIGFDSYNQVTYSECSQTLKAEQGGDSAAKVVVSKACYQNGQGDCFEPKYWKSNSDGVAETQMATQYKDPQIIAGVRRLTPTECERLQGFSDGWTDGQADSHRYKQMGNAVTVNVAEWIGKRINQSITGAKMYQKLIIIGNLGSNPEMRFTPSGDPVTTFSVATSRKYGEKDETTWFRVSVWGKQAETCNQYLHKGSKVLVEGRLRPDSNGSPTVFQRKDGTWSASYEITAESVRFLTANGEQVESADLDVPF